ncbi:MAG: hypothetical protein C3F08_00645 [Candidatus Methylomirabilota bacterium]|nr:MAG: hypothetical protein C3F08_00645 [candidate division NC10 bacterium]
MIDVCICTHNPRRYILSLVLNDLRKLNLKVFGIGVRPVVSQSEALGDKIELSEGFFRINWQGQNTVEEVENDLWVSTSLRIRLWQEKKSHLLREGREQYKAGKGRTHQEIFGR